MKKLMAVLLFLSVTASSVFPCFAETEDLTENEAAVSESGGPAAYEDVFSAWNEEAPALQELIDYVEDVTDEVSDDYIPPEDRIAVFDLNGTLYGELFPTYFDYYMLAWRILEDPAFQPDEEMLAAAREIRDTAAADHNALNRSFTPDMRMRYAAQAARAYAGMTISEFADYVTEILLRDADGFEGMTYGEAFYLPMTEVVEYLQDNAFNVFVVSGSDRFICRTLLEGNIDVPSQNIIGMDVAMEAGGQDGTDGPEYVFDPENDELVRSDRLLINNMKMKKVSQIACDIGRQPVLSFGNTVEDVSMHNYTVSSSNPYRSAAFMLVADDEERDYGNPEIAESQRRQWEENGYHVISVKDDFRTIYGDDVKKTGIFHWAEELEEQETERPEGEENKAGTESLNAEASAEEAEMQDAEASAAEEGMQDAEASAAEEGMQNAEVPSAEEEIQNAEVPSAEEEMQNAEVPSAEEGMQNAEVPPAEEGMQNAEVPAAEAEMQDAEVPAAEAGMQNAEVPPAEAEMRNAEAFSEDNALQDAEALSEEETMINTESPLADTEDQAAPEASAETAETAAEEYIPDEEHSDVKALLGGNGFSDEEDYMPAPGFPGEKFRMPAYRPPFGAAFIPGYGPGIENAYGPHSGYGFRDEDAYGQQPGYGFRDEDAYGQQPGISIWNEDADSPQPGIGSWNEDTYGQQPGFGPGNGNVYGPRQGYPSAPDEGDAAGADIQYVMYLGTNDKDTNEPVFTPEEAKDKAKEILIEHFGGYTIQEAEGGWIDEDGTVCQEYTLVIYLSDTTADDVHEAADELIRTFNQSSVLIQANRTRTEFYPGD